MISPLISDSESLGVLSLILGKVNLSRAEYDSWTKAKLKSVLYLGDQLKTGEKSRCEIKVAGNMVIRVGEVTNFIIADDLNSTGNINVYQGNVWINLFFPDKDNKVKIRTPTAVASIRGTVYRLSCDPSHSTFRVYDGSVTVNPLDEEGKIIPDSTFVVESGFELVLVKDFTEYERQQRNAFNNYLKEQQFGFEEYVKQQEKFFRDFKRREQEAFKKFKDYFVAHEEFDLENDLQSDWVKWNTGLDELIEQK